MPEIPLYKRQVELPSTTSPYLENVEAGGRVGRAIKGIGEDLLKRAEEKRNEQNALTALEKSSVLSERAQQFELEQKKLRGVDAEGGTERMAKFVDDQYAELAEGMNYDTSLRFQEYRADIRRSFTGKMATHEANEHRVRRDNAINVMIGTFRNRIQGGDMSVAERDRNIAAVQKTIAEVNRGYGQTFIQAVQEQSEDKMVADWLIARARRYPKLVLNELHQYKQTMSEEEISAVETVLQKVVHDDLARQEFHILKAKHGDDYKAMLAEADKEENNDLRIALEQEIKTSYATHMQFYNDALTKSRDAAVKEIAAAFAVDKLDMKLASDTLQKYYGVLSGEQYRYWNDRITDMTERRIQNIRNENSDFFLEHPEKFDAVFGFIQTHGDLLEPLDIRMLMGTDLSIAETDKLMKALLDFKKNGPSRLQPALRMVQQWETDDLLKSDDQAENAFRAAAIRKRLYEWHRLHPVDQFPLADPIEDVLRPQRKLFLEDDAKPRIKEAFESAHRDSMGGIVVPKGGPPRKKKETVPMPPRPDLKPMPDFNTSDYLRKTFPGIITETQAQTPEIKPKKKGVGKEALGFALEMYVPGWRIFNGILNRLGIVGEDEKGKSEKEAEK